MIEPGAILDHKFRIERILGQGGMGVVAVATHLELDQRVAIKVLRDHGASDPASVERLLREARAAARLRSDHVCRVSDVGRLGDGSPYLVMELLEGQDLAAVIARAPLPIATAVDYALQAGVAIAEAHAAGIIHRDLKPANLFVTKRLDGTPLVKVLDFGIAKAARAAELALTATDTVMGSPGYMSPEQLRSARDVDARTDIWALGVILYQAISGRLPFPATTITELALKVAGEPPDPLDVDPAVRGVIFRCLEKRPHDRYADVGALAAALAPFGGPTAAAAAELIAKVARPASLEATLPAVDARAATSAERTVPTGASAPVGPAPRTTRSRRPAILAGAGGVAIIAVVIAVVAHHRAPAPDPHAEKLRVLHAKLEHALAADRCLDAAQASYDLLRLGEDQAVMDPLNVRTNVCSTKVSHAVDDPGAPGAARLLLISAEESFDLDQPSGSTPLIDMVLEHPQAPEDEDRARVLGIKIGCKLHDRALVARYGDKLGAGPARADATAYCKTAGFPLD